MNITLLIKALLLLLSFAYTAFLLPYIKSKLNESQREKLWNVVVMAVQAAEMIYGSGTGALKYEFVEQYLADRGFKLDAQEVKVLIESAVLELKNSLA